jgi:probable phosphoglycerate mutase
MVLVRHGEAACNVNGIVGGARGCTGLTPRGVAQAEALRDRLARTHELDGTVAVYASTLPRAAQTAAIVLPALQAGGDGPPLTVQPDADLCELRPGEADGLTWEEFGARFATPDWDTRPDQPIAPGGESWVGFVGRASEALRQVADDVRAARPPAPEGANIVVVFCHAGVIEASMLRLLPVDPSVPRLRLRTVHASLTEWCVGPPLLPSSSSLQPSPQPQPQAWALERYNDAAHLLHL